MGPEDRVLALDNVPLELPIAGAGSRALAAFLDYLLVGIASIVCVVAVVALGNWAELSFGWGFALAVVGLFLLDYGYFAGTEVATGGRTFGKWALDLRVTTRQGGRPSASALLVRNAVRTVDLLVGVPLMVADPLARRLGDRLAGTVVLHGRRREAEPVLARVPRSWGGPEVALLETFLARAPDLEPHRSEALARRFLDWIARDDPEILAGAAPEVDPLSRLRRAVTTRAG
jgi:uncharacterized RDD family membrane protein YckC